jgi:biotin carboxyl carrier protein
MMIGTDSHTVNAGGLGMVAVVVLEAMKMQNNIEAEKDGKVTAICVKPGQAVLEEDALVVIE